jgi:hypothetical protein
MFILGQTGCNLRVLFAERLLTHSPRVCEARNRKVPASSTRRLKSTLGKKFGH